MPHTGKIVGIVNIFGKYFFKHLNLATNTEAQMQAPKIIMDCQKYLHVATFQVITNIRVGLLPGFKFTSILVRIMGFTCKIMVSNKNPENIIIPWLKIDSFRLKYKAFRERRTRIKWSQKRLMAEKNNDIKSDPCR